MIATIAHTWPWSAPDSEFWLAWVVLCGVCAGLGIVGALILDSALQRPPSSPSSTSLLVGASTSSTTLRPGLFPRGEAVWVTAWLAGPAHLGAAWAAAATTAGWLRLRGDGPSTLLPEVTPSDPLLARCKEILDDPGAGSTLRRRLETAVTRLEPLVRSRAEALGVVRSVPARLGLVAVAALGVVPGAVVAGWRFVVVDRDDHLALCATTIAVELIVVVAVTAWLTARSRHTRAFLRWLDDSVAALRADVRAGVLVDAADVVLIAALDGWALGQTGARLGVDAIAPTTRRARGSVVGVGSR
jgi:hypothetical protein